MIISIQSFAQSNPRLAKKIAELAEKVIPYVYTEDVFLKTGKSEIKSDEYTELKKIVMSNGFPTVSMVGKENSHKFWMMIQLCDFDNQLQAATLKQMRRLLRKGDIINEDYAMLTDRTRLNNGIPQLYGTQFVLDHDGVVMIYQIQDMENVNDRRKSLNLSKLEEVEKPVLDTFSKKGVDEFKYNDTATSN
jgi:uncharacterized protein DUF6624